MINQLSTKIVKLDLEYILNNFLNKKLWKKKWTIFQFGDYEITTNIYTIEVSRSTVWLDIDIINKNNYNVASGLYAINYDTSNRNMTVIKNGFDGKVSQLIEKMENSEIKKLDVYDNALNLEIDLEKKLVDKCNNLLDELNINNEDIREAYIEQQKNNSDIDGKYTDQLINDLKYKLLSSFYLTYLAYSGYESKYKYILSILENTLEDTESIIKDIKETIDNFEVGEFIDSIELEDI